jgi:import inner membrane translocase subunit TIM13
LGVGVVYVAMESTLSSGQLSGLQKDELMEQVKQQIAVANAQELLTVYSI